MHAQVGRGRLRLLQVDKTQVDDLAYCKTAMLGFQSFIAQFEGQSLYTRRDLDFKNVTATITDLIYFVTIPTSSTRSSARGCPTCRASCC